MPTESSLEITTSEGITLTAELAGIGSRFLAQAYDFIILGLLLLVLFLLGRLIGFSGGFGVAMAILIVVFVMVGIPILFEMFWSGLTPGKRSERIRVTMVDGTPLTKSAAFIRNIFRLIDFLPASYFLGFSSMLISSKSQRLGDLAAGTVVMYDSSVRSRLDQKEARREAKRRRKLLKKAGRLSVATVVTATEAMGWDIARLTGQERDLIVSVVARMDSLKDDSLQRLAAKVAGQVRPKVAAPVDIPDDVRFLIELSRVIGGA